MKYQVLCDEYILYDKRDEELFLESPVLTREVNKVGALTFTIYPNHRYFDELKYLKSNIEVLRNDKPIFRGRIIDVDQGIYNQKSVECESTLAFLNDSYVAPYVFEGSPEELFVYLIDNHNMQVTEDRQLKIGNITVKDDNDYIRRSWSNYEKTLDLINSRCIDSLGGYLVERYEEDGNYIDWLEDFSKTTVQNIEFSKNLLDIFARNDATKTYSVVVPIGANIEQEDGSQIPLTIESVNEGKDYLINNEAFEKYGWIVAPISETTWEDVTLPENLLKKGQAFLDNSATGINSNIELKAIDLSIIDKSYESFFIYEYINIISKVHNINDKLLLRSITIPLDMPENTIIDLSETRTTLSGIELENKKNAQDIVSRVGTIEQDYVKNKEVPNIVERSIEESSFIQQLPNQIMERVSESYTSITKSNEDYNELLKKFDSYVTEENIDVIKKSVEDVINSTERVTTIVEEIEKNGVSQVKTETGFTFNKDGLNISKSNAPTSSTLDEAGLEIKDKTGASESTQSYTGYVDDDIAKKNPILDPFKGTTVTYQKNAIIEEYLVFPNWRIEEIGMDNSKNGLAFFYIGGE